jgi:UDP-GlcNAc:undecaprenyl-phosphate GlcNAc-1-phosphate transferase
MADARHLHHRFIRLGFSQRRAVLHVWVWCGTLALAALATRFAAPRHHGHWNPTNIAIDVAAGGLAVACSLYIVYLLEIVKVANPRLRRRQEQASKAA